MLQWDPGVKLFLVEQVTWAFNLQRRSHPQGRARTLWHIRSCVSGWDPLIGFIEVVKVSGLVLVQNSMTEIHWDVFCATVVFTAEYVAPVSVRKSINLFPNGKVTEGSCGEIRISCIKFKGAPGTSRSLSEYSPLSTLRGSCPPDIL